MDDPEAASSTTRKGLVREARISALREALVACDIEEMIEIWIRRPNADTAEGRAWEAGARQASKWKNAAILTLIEEGER